MITEALAFSIVPPGVGEPVRFLALAVLSVMIIGAAKSGFAAGGGPLSVPLMIYACGGDALLANGIMLPMLIACDYVCLIAWWGQWDRRNALMLVPGMVVGIGMGWLTLWLFLRMGQSNADRTIANAALSFTVGVMAVGFVALQIIRFFRGNLGAFRPTFIHGWFFGSVGGLVSTLTNAAGPITAMFLLPQQMPKGRYVATTVLYAWIGNQIKLIPYFFLGMLSAPSLSADAALLPAVVGGALLGVFLHHRVNEKRFGVIVHVLLGAVGLHLTVTSAWKLWL